MGKGHSMDLALPEVEFLEAFGGVGGGESIFDEELGDSLHFPFSFFFTIFLSLVVLSISTSNKVRRAPKSAKASMAMVTLPWATIWARCCRAAAVLEGSITVMALE